MVWDPQKLLGPNSLQLFSLHEKSYIPMKEMWFPAVGLGLTLWHGTYAAVEADWLRWCDQKGKLIPTGAEQCQRADKEAKRAEQEAKRVEQLAAQLRALGIEPKEE